MDKNLNNTDVVDTVVENILNEMKEKELTFEQCRHAMLKVSSKLSKMKSEMKINQIQNHQEKRH